MSEVSSKLSYSTAITVEGYLRSQTLKQVTGVMISFNPLVHSVLLKGRYKKLDVRKSHSIFK